MRRFEARRAAWLVDVAVDLMDGGDGVTWRVAWLHVAPIKSLAIQVRQRIVLGPRGVEEDRRFCVVDDEGRMLNAKRVPAFVRVRPELDEAMRDLTLHTPTGSVSGPVELGDTVAVSIYRRRVPAREVRGPFSAALSDLGGRAVRLVRFDEPGEGVDRAGESGHVSLLSRAALDALAEVASADRPVDPRRFRMNIGISGIAAHEEDAWIGRRVTVGDAVVVPGGNVGRCAVTTLDPESGASDLDTLAALARYRPPATTEPLAFGVWARVERPGAISLGDKITV